MDRKLEDRVSSSDLTLHLTMQGINLSLSLMLHSYVIPTTPPAVPVSHIYHGYHISYSVQEHFKDQRSPFR